MTRLSRGFTIVELLIVVVVIAILAAITVVAYSGIQNSAHASITVSNIRQYETALEVYKIENGAYYQTAFLPECVGYTKDNDGDCIYYIYTGASCLASVGVAEGRYTRSEVFEYEVPDGLNDALSSFIGSGPVSVQTKPIESIVSTTPECTVTQEYAAPTYASGCSVNIEPDGSATVTISPCPEGRNTSYRMQYVLTGDADCVLKSAHKRFVSDKGLTVCSINKGKVVYV